MPSGRAGRDALTPPEEAAAHPDLQAALAVKSNRIVGAPSTADQGAGRLVAATGADEIMVSAAADSLDVRASQLRAARIRLGGGTLILRPTPPNFVCKWSNLGPRYTADCASEELG